MNGIQQKWMREELQILPESNTAGHDIIVRSTTAKMEGL